MWTRWCVLVLAHAVDTKEDQNTHVRNEDGPISVVSRHEGGRTASGDKAHEIQRRDKF